MHEMKDCNLKDIYETNVNKLVVHSKPNLRANKDLSRMCNRLKNMNNENIKKLN